MANGDNRRRWRTLIKIHKEAQLKDRKSRTKRKKRERKRQKMEKPNVLWPHFVLFISFLCGEQT